MMWRFLRFACLLSCCLLLTADLTAQTERVSIPDLREKLQLTHVIKTPIGRFDSAYVSKRGDRVVVKGNANGIRMFSLLDGHPLSSIKPCGGKKFTSFPFVENNALVAIGCEGTGITEIWDPSHVRLLRKIQFSKAPYIRATISPSAVTMVLENPHAEPTELWHVGKGTRISTLTPYLTKGARDSETVAYSPDGRMIAVSYNADLYLWDARTGEMLQFLVDSPTNLKLPGGIVAAHRSVIYYLLFSHNGKYLFSGSVDSTVKQWDVSTGKLIRTFSGHNAGISSLALSPDGSNLATGSHDKKVKLWSVETGRLLWTSPDHGGYAWQIFFGPDGKRLLTMTGRGNIGDANVIRMWETATGQLLGQMSGKWWQSFFSPDLKHFVTVGKKKNTIELYRFGEKVIL